MRTFIEHKIQQDRLRKLKLTGAVNLTKRFSVVVQLRKWTAYVHFLSLKINTRAARVPTEVYIIYYFMCQQFGLSIGIWLHAAMDNQSTQSAAGSSCKNKTVL